MQSSSAQAWLDTVDALSAAAQDPLLQTGATAALLSAVTYTLLYKSSQLLSPKLCKGYSRLKDKEKVDWNTRSPSTVHAVVVSFLCFYALCYSGDFFDSGLSFTASSSIPAVFKVSDLSYSVIGISLGYFLMDAAVLAAVPEIGSTELYIHHAVALLSLAVAAQVHCMHVYLLMVMLSEVTTPSVNLRWYLDKADLKSTKLYTANGLLLLLLWGVARVLLFIPFYAHVLQNWQYVMQIPVHASVLLLGVPLLLFVLNTRWFIKIVKGAYKLVFPPAAVSVTSGKQQHKQAVEIMAFTHSHSE